MALMTHKDDLMPILRKEFEKEYNGKTLQGVIKKECAGEFEAALVSLASYTPPKGAKPLGPDDEVPPPPESAAPPQPVGYGAAAPPQRRRLRPPPRRRKPCTSRRHPLATPPAGTPRNRPRVKIRGDRVRVPSRRRRHASVSHVIQPRVIFLFSRRLVTHRLARPRRSTDAAARRAARARPSRCVARVASRDARSARARRATRRRRDSTARIPTDRDARI